MNRRHFIHSSAALSLINAIAAEKPKRLILRSSWQTVNIGDIAHTPGVLALLEKHLPEVEVRLWPSNLDNGVGEMLAARFPKVKVIRGEEVLKAFDECDFLLHGSGPSLVATGDVLKWKKATGKPYGVYGITYSGQNAKPAKPEAKDKDKPTVTLIDVFNGAKFVYFRDSVSLALAQKHGCTCPLMEFGPDGAFAVDLKDDAKAEAFMKEHGLEQGKFLCCIPRMRNTPYWTLPEKHAVLDEKKHARNEEMKDHDGKPLLDAIVSVIKNTDLKILICPEDKTQMQIGKEMLYDKLPEDVKTRVVWRENYWLTDEAISTYRRSAGLFGHEMHSPIMCIGNGIPAIVCRWAEQTSKGYMWRDIGLGDWLFDLDKEEELQNVAATVLAMAKDPAGSKAKAEKARDFVMAKFAASMAVMKSNLPA